MWQQCLVYECGKTLWTRYTRKAKDVKTADQVQDYVVKMVLGGWKEELLDIASQCLCNVTVMKKLYLDEDLMTEGHLQKHWKFTVSLISERAMSLVAQCCKPPWRYAALCWPETFADTQKRMQGEWGVILQAEMLQAMGHAIWPLEQAHFLKTAFVRLHFLLNESDLGLGLGHGDANAVLFSQTATRNIGDTVVVENCHQKVKDLLHAADQISRPQKYQSVINSEVFAGRGLPSVCVCVTDEQKASASCGRNRVQSIQKATHPNSHQLNREYQSVMKHKGSGPNFTWPSTSHHSLFLWLVILQASFCVFCGSLIIG